jgi:hypothetical protein
VCFYSYFQDLYTALLLNQDDLRLRCERYFDILESNSPVLVFTDVVREFYSGLASYKIYRETRDPSWLQRGKACKENILLWTEQGSLQHFQHNKYLLLEAEENFCINNFADARNLYKEAITSAEAHQFLNEVALAAECAANLYFEIGDTETSFENFMLAHNKYISWNAHAKANKLFENISQKFASVASPCASTSVSLGFEKTRMDAVE